MARDLLMLSLLPLLSQDMDMVMDMAMDILATDMVVKQEPECCYFLEFSTTEVDQNRSSQNKHTL